MVSAGLVAVHVVPEAQWPAAPSLHHGTHTWFWHVVSGPHADASAHAAPEAPPLSGAATQAVWTGFTPSSTGMQSVPKPSETGAPHVPVESVRSQSSWHVPYWTPFTVTVGTIAAHVCGTS